MLTITAAFPSLHTLCIGPGLETLSCCFYRPRKGNICNLALVLDADTLYMLSLEDYRDILEQLLSYDNDVITPNSLKSKRPKEALHNIRNNEDFLEDEKWG